MSPQRKVSLFLTLTVSFSALSYFPILLSQRMNKKQEVMLTGLIIFSIGGLVPLIMRVDTLPLILLAASAVEIFFQNFSTGAVATYLLGQSE